jgi:hypothetical protein
MSINRRQALAGTTALLLSGIGSTRISMAAESPAVAFLDKSALIYLTPLLADGRESTCHSEIWFVHHKQEIFVVTKADAWRAEALRRGYRRASIWIGEFGNWKKANDKYRSAPHLNIEGSLETQTDVQADVLGSYASKYADEWGSWGPRFQKGLADGSRVMLRYTVSS